jgi:hypothetical protein
MATDDDKTLVDTPSAMLRLGLESCPLCKRIGILTGGLQCWFCEGARVVTKERADDWRKAHPPKTPDYDTLPDTLPQSSNPPPKD